MFQEYCIRLFIPKRIISELIRIMNLTFSCIRAFFFVFFVELFCAAYSPARDNGIISSWNTGRNRKGFGKIIELHNPKTILSYYRDKKRFTIENV